MDFVGKMVSAILEHSLMETAVLNAVKTAFLVQIFSNAVSALMDLSQSQFLLVPKLLLHVVKFAEMGQDLLKNVMMEIPRMMMDVMNTVKLRADGTVMVEEP